MAEPQIVRIDFFIGRSPQCGRFSYRAGITSRGTVILAERRAGEILYLGTIVAR